MANAPPSRGPAASIPWLLFGFRGRIGRQSYWLSYFFLIAVNSVLVAQLVGGEQASLYRLANLLAPVAGLVTLFSNIAVTVKRLHDFGMNGLFAIAVLVPFLNIAFTIWAGVVPGNRGPNAYGALPDRPPA